MDMKNKTYFDERNIKNIETLYKYIDELPEFCYEYFVGIENRTSPLTRVNYAMDISVFLDFLSKRRFHKNIKDITIEDLNKVSALDVESFLSYLSYYRYQGKEYKNGEKGKSRKLAAIRSLFKYFFNRDKLVCNVASKVETPKIHDKPIIRLEEDEVEDLINQAESPYLLTRKQQLYNKHTNIRDVAILTLLLGTGIRISECVGLNVDDFDFKNNSFKVTRKGGNQSILYFSDEVATAINDYMEYRDCNPNLDPNEKALFISMQNKRMSVRAIEKLVKKYSTAITPLKKITPHKLRSTYGTNLYRKTQDIYVVAEVLGHKDVNTTKKHYAAMSEQIRRSAADKVQLRKSDNK